MIKKEIEYFVFYSTWTWPERSGEIQYNDEGFTVYKRAGKKLEDVLSFTNGIPTNEEVFNFLTRNNIRKLYTLDIPSEGYLGLTNEDVDQDKDVIDRKSVEPYIKFFQEKGIEIIVLKP
jgi:hypothetical protein